MSAHLQPTEFIYCCSYADVVCVFFLFLILNSRNNRVTIQSVRAESLRGGGSIRDVRLLFFHIIPVKCVFIL